jgi:hypothetical protein
VAWRQCRAVSPVQRPAHGYRCRPRACRCCDCQHSASTPDGRFLRQ